MAITEVVTYQLKMGQNKAAKGGRSQPLLDATRRLQDLADRWDKTTEWHNPPFLDGRINITTGDLMNIAIVCREVLASRVKRTA